MMIAVAENVGLYVLLAAVLLVALWVMVMFNSLVRLRQHVRESWSGVETELQRRYHLIPNIVATVQGYAKHERELLDRIVQLRNQAEHNHGEVGSQARDENQMVSGLRQLFAVVEAYPDLKADRHFLALQQQLANTEDRIQTARRFYNANVRDLNTRVRSFPSNLIANAFGFEVESFFEVDSADVRAVPTVPPAPPTS
ncbi:MAG: LemA family protein [Phycisphaeraceae bacterium]